MPEEFEGGQFCVICLLLTEVMDISCSECYWPSKSVNLFCSVSYNKLIYKKNVNIVCKKGNVVQLSAPCIPLEFVNFFLKTCSVSHLSTHSFILHKIIVGGVPKIA